MNPGTNVRVPFRRAKAAEIGAGQHQHPGLERLLASTQAAAALPAEARGSSPLLLPGPLLLLPVAAAARGADPGGAWGLLSTSTSLTMKSDWLRSIFMRLASRMCSGTLSRGQGYW